MCKEFCPLFKLGVKPNADMKHVWKVDMGRNATRVQSMAALRALSFILPHI